MAGYKSKAKAKPKSKGGYKKRAPMRKNNNVTVIRENYHRETLKGYAIHTEAASTKCSVTMACGPAGVLGGANRQDANTAIFPNWAALADKYEEYRVIYASLTTILKSAENVVFSLIERDNVQITDTAAMNKNPQRQLHIMDGDNKKVLRAWKPSTSADYDFQSTSSLTAKAHIKMLQAGLPTEDQKCENAVCIVCEFRGLKN